MGLRVTLDSTLLADTPLGWDKADINSKRDKVIRGLFLNYTTNITFWGDGFDYIDTILNQDYCQVIDVLIESDDCQSGTWETEFIGVIQLTQLSKYDVDKRLIETKILDESFDAKIDNNKSLKAYVDVGTSKNSVNIQAASPVDLSVFHPSPGTAFNDYIAITRESYRVYDCFRFIVDYMTDGQVGFKSDLFAGDYYNWFLVNGKELRIGGGNGDQLEVSFKQLFTELHKKTNLAFAIEPTPTGYTNEFQLRLESTDYFEQDNAIVTLDNVRGINMNFNRDELFSNVEIGSEDFDDRVVLSYPPLNFKAFKEENYTIQGQCNVDKTMNLVSKFIIDTNVIEDVLEQVTSGTATSLSTGKLIDASNNFSLNAIEKGYRVYNKATGASTTVSNVDSNTQLDLEEDIFGGAQQYDIFKGITKYDKEIYLIVGDENDKAIKYKEYDDPVSEGTDDGGVVNRLTDSTADFNADGVVAGDMAFNMLTGLTANINSVDAGGTFCTLDTDIFNNGDGYQVRDSPFNYNNPLTNVEVISRFTGGLPNSVIKHIGAGGTANFEAGTTSDVVDSSFPATTNPIQYDDDSTPPFFDDGSNYDTGNYEYTVPSSGLFGFRGTGVFRLNGQLDADIITNGDFTGGSTDWTYTGSPFETFPNEYENTFTTGSSFLKQQQTIDGGSVYVVTFDAKSHGIYVLVNGVSTPWINDPNNFGSYTIILDYRNNPNPPQHIEFTFTGNHGVTTAIDNVVVQATPRFHITQTIQRSSSTGQLLQTFGFAESIAFDHNQFQREEVLIAEQTFSTFSGEQISVRLDVLELNGTSMQSTLLTDLLNQTTGDTDYTSFQTILSDDGGGDILPVNETDFPIYQYKFEKALTFDQFKSLTDAPEKAILFSKGTTNHIFGWRNSIKWNRKTGLAKFELRSKTKINGDCES